MKEKALFLNMFFFSIMALMSEVITKKFLLEAFLFTEDEQFWEVTVRSGNVILTSTAV